MRTDRRLERIRSVLGRRQDDLTVVLEDIHDPHNVSAILRSADAVGIGEIQLLYTKEKFPSIGKKSSASASKWVSRRKFRSVSECYTVLHSEGFKIYASRLGSGSRSLFEMELTGKVALAFGNEHHGVSEEAGSLADECFMIPMHGMIESLNVSVACAVTLYEALRQRLAAGHLASPKLNASMMKALEQDWGRK